MVETHGLDTPPYEEYEVCPGCFSTNITKGIQCDCCGEYIIDRYAQVESGERYCDSCYVVKDFPE